MRLRSMSWLSDFLMMPRWLRSGCASGDDHPGVPQEELPVGQVHLPPEPAGEKASIDRVVDKTLMAPAVLHRSPYVKLAMTISAKWLVVSLA